MLTIKNRRNILFGKFLVLYLIILVMLTFGVYKMVHNKVVTDIKQEERRDAYLLTNKANDIVNQLRTDLLFLASEVELFHNTEEAHFITLTASLFQKYASAIHVYDQIRYLDTLGREVVRMNFDNNNAEIIAEDQLQEKGTRYYFNETMKKEGRDIYISPIDLNMENGNVEIPYNPTIRIGVNLYDNENKKIGILVTNFKAESLINIIRNRSKATTGEKYLINKDGYYIIGPDIDREWGFMFGKSENTFLNDFAKEADIIFKNENGIFSLDKGLFVFSTIHFEPRLSDKIKHINNWKLVSYVSSEKVFDIVFDYFKRGLAYAFGISLVIIILLWILAGNIYQRQKVQKALESSNKALEEIVRTKDKFFSIISHDLRSPFTGIIGYSHMLKSDLDSYSKEEVKQFVTYINKSAENTYKMLDNLLKWARVQSGKMEPKPEVFELKDVLEMTQASFASTVTQKDLEFMCSCKETYDVYADRLMIRTVVHNIISNAIKFTPRGGTISLEVKKENNAVCLNITDTGIGMNKETLNNLFKVDKVTSTKGTEDESGTGLGLILAKEFIDINNGKIEVKSVQEKGTTFSIYIPIYHKNMHA